MEFNHNETTNELGTEMSENSTPHWDAESTSQSLADEFVDHLPTKSDRSSIRSEDFRSDQTSLEVDLESDFEEMIPVLTQFRIVLFSQHESSVKVIKEHQYLLNTVLLLAEQTRRQKQVLERELELLLKLSPDRLNQVHERVGRLLLRRPAHELRKQHELRIFHQRRQLRCLELKIIYLEKVMLEERARAKTRVDRLQRNYQRQRG